jgi:hypothetical protein
VERRESAPEGPDRPASVFRVTIPAHQLQWLLKQADFLDIPIEQLVADALDESLFRIELSDLPPDPSPIVQRALDQFMRRHRDEFLPVFNDEC